jgi:hypothetical protein
MKKALFISLLLFLMVSCLKDPDYHGFKVRLAIDFVTDVRNGNKEGIKVTLFNQTKNYTFESITNTEGIVQFEPVEPGFYSVTVSHSIQSGLQLTHYNGQKNIEVFDDFSDSVKITGSNSGAFVIKEFYYSGSVTPAGKKYFADQYLEIFNNTNEIQYADGLSVLEHDSYGSGTNFWANIQDTIVAGMIWTIPGSGMQVPVLPGKSIILATNGINHKDDPNGNPLSPVNLGNADFEFYVFKQPEKDLDSPTVPNLEEDIFVFREVP